MNHYPQGTEKFLSRNVKLITETSNPSWESLSEGKGQNVPSLPSRSPGAAAPSAPSPLPSESRCWQDCAVTLSRQDATPRTARTQTLTVSAPTLSLLLSSCYLSIYYKVITACTQNILKVDVSVMLNVRTFSGSYFTIVSKYLCKLKGRCHNGNFCRLLKLLSPPNFPTKKSK